jgi:Mg2+/Co2+ transporter CorB
MRAFYEVILKVPVYDRKEHILLLIEKYGDTLGIIKQADVMESWLQLF